MAQQFGCIIITDLLIRVSFVETQEPPCLTTTRSEALFEHLLLQHQHQIYGFILSLVRNTKDAEDIFQDVCLVLWERFATFTPGTNFVAWGSTIARFRVQKFFRKNSKVQQVEFREEAYDRLADVQSQLARMCDGERHAQLRLCVDRLPEHLRTLLLSCYNEHQGVREVAEELGRTTHSVYSSLRHIRGQLRSCMRKAEMGAG